LIRLTDADERNLNEARRLCTDDHQRSFLDDPTGIIARGYAYRTCNARVIGIADDDRIIGLALVRDMDEEPACYDLQQFMIDRRFQNKGYGTEALRSIVSMLLDEGKYDCVEACVSKYNAPALRMFEKTGFRDTGHIDDDLPDCLNLRYSFRNSRNETGHYADELISDFSNPLFRTAFRRYFSELGIDAGDWDGLFREMNAGGDMAFVRMDGKEEVVGFVLFNTIVFTSWFFEETYGFIRELWVAGKHRKDGHGSELLKNTEKYLYNKEVYSTILTSDTAERFYMKNGYVKVPGCKAKNEDDVFVKRLK
jgi:RimJ/RimL family protein N-acetyltransferase